MRLGEPEGGGLPVVAESRAEVLVDAEPRLVELPQVEEGVDSSLILGHNLVEQARCLAEVLGEL